MPTSALQIQLLFGPGSGRTISFTQGPVTFGRDADNTLIVPESFVSRHHGEFQLTAEGWRLVNQSPNGTRLNKRLITHDKPHPIKNGDEVGIGDLAVFQVTLQDVAAPASAAPPGATARVTPAPLGGPAAAAPPHGLTKRAKLLLSIIAGWIVVLGVLAFLIVPPGGGRGNARSLTPLTNKEIEAILLKPLPPRPTDPVMARQRLQEAKDLAADTSRQHASLFKSYRAFEEALVLYGTSTFRDPQDEWLYLNVQDRVIKDLTERYGNAYDRLKSGQFQTAAQEYGRLSSDLYFLFAADRDNPLSKSVSAFQQAANSKTVPQ